MTKQRILFVDDEKLILKALDAAMKPMREEWDVHFANSGQAAVLQMATMPFDVIVTDMRMPGMNGAELLKEVCKCSPRSIRILLSGYADDCQIMDVIGSAHQFIMKPFNLDALLNMLTRLGRLNEWMTNDTPRCLVTGMSHLPTPPKIYMRIMDVLQSPDSAIHDIADIISTDPALTAKLLQLVNSAFFGIPRPISTVHETVQVLGMETIRSLVLASHVFSAFERVRFEELPVEKIWAHSIQTGRLAAKIARRQTHDPTVLSQSFTAGCLHDIGKLIFAANLPTQYRDVLQSASMDGRRLIQIERQSLGANHAETGAYLLGIWGLPAPLVEAVVWHHEPSRSNTAFVSPLTAVHIADALVHVTSGDCQGEDACRIDTDYLGKLGLPIQLDAWLARLAE